MDFRDALATFGSFLPPDARIDEKRMMICFEYTGEVPQPLLAARDAAQTRVRGTEAAWRVAVRRNDGPNGGGEKSSEALTALALADEAYAAFQTAQAACVAEDEEHELPFTWEVCGACGGRGSYVNPAIDAHGITSEEWDQDWDEESREGYMSGAYDVPCENCRGRRVEPSPTEPTESSSAAHKAAWKAWQLWAEDESVSRRERESEMRYGY